MSFEFFTPEGVSVRCETVDELCEAYSALWRDNKHTAQGFWADDELSAPHTVTNTEGEQVRHLTALPPLEVEDPFVGPPEAIYMPRHWHEVWRVLRDRGDEGITVVGIAEYTGRNKNTIASITVLMNHQGFIEKAESRGHWRVPADLRHFEPTLSRILPE